MEKQNVTGKVYLVGAGPGDPGLITVKGLNLLKNCDVVIYDRLVSTKLLGYVKDDCELVYVGKEVGSHAIKQDEINQILIEKACSASVVVRLKGGDPYVFGRGGEEVLALREKGIPYEVVPGITSAIAGAAYAGIPITHRGVSQGFHVITGHTSEEEFNLPDSIPKLAKLNGTLVILMGVGNLEKIRDELIANGKPAQTPVAVVSNATTIWQREVRGTLGDICQKVKENAIKAPALIIIGGVASLDMRTTLTGPLNGAKIGITGTKNLSGRLEEYFENLGAKTEILGTSDIVEYKDNIVLEKALRNLVQYNWIVFTSTNAVSIFFRKMIETGVDYRSLAQIRFAVVGSGTKNTLQQFGFHTDFMPEVYTVTHLADELCSIFKKTDRILIPRAEQGSEDLIQIFNQHKIGYDDVKIYDIQVRNNLLRIETGNLEGLHYITFASASGVHGLMKEHGWNPEKIFTKTKAVCIGDATEAALREYGISNILVAKEASVRGLVEGICEDFGNV